MIPTVHGAEMKGDQPTHRGPPVQDPAPLGSLMCGALLAKAAQPQGHGGCWAEGPWRKGSGVGSPGDRKGGQPSGGPSWVLQPLQCFLLHAKIRQSEALASLGLGPTWNEPWGQT